MKIHVGTSGFAYKEWKGTFYPEKIAPEEMLGAYARRLGAVEINNTFYHMPTARVLEGWAAQVPKAFRFAFKAPQLITHFKRLRHVDEEIDYLFKTLSLLGPRLGPVLFQFPASFPLDRPALEGLLNLIPGKAACAFEFRHPSWLDDGVLGLLRDEGVQPVRRGHRREPCNGDRRHGVLGLPAPAPLRLLGPRAFAVGETDPVAAVEAGLRLHQARGRRRKDRSWRSDSGNSRVARPTAGQPPGKPRRAPERYKENIYGGGATAGMKNLSMRSSRRSSRMPVRLNIATLARPMRG